MSVAFVREESAEAAQGVSLPPRAISAHPNLVTQSGLRALEQALADSQQALKAAQIIEDANERRRALELAARDARYFVERVASAVPQPEPADTVVAVFGSGHDPARRWPPSDVPNRWRGRGRSPWRIDRLCVPACPSAHRKAHR
jgi:hypothetical protein